MPSKDFSVEPIASKTDLPLEPSVDLQLDSKLGLPPEAIGSEVNSKPDLPLESSLRHMEEPVLPQDIDTSSSKDLGSLKIFFGYAAGVGKTYAMLMAAQAVLKNGVDVVVGYVEPHSRLETEALLVGLEALPTLKISYQDVVLQEFDLDAAIRRKPQLILVDEMAHSNARGCRHRKRYQDIQELLRHGIDVYTTVNVQHVESLNDVVESITGIAVRERVPDKVFDSAQHVELVDIEPEDLLQRLQAGKIYQQKQIGRALGNFFVKENLVALREIALRRTADIVNKDVEKHKVLHQRSDYFTNEHILLCLSSSPSNPKVIRTAKRMAEAFHGRLTALFVETSATSGMSAENRRRLLAHTQLAEDLGAHLATVQGNDVAWHVAAFAKASGVSKIVIGRPGNMGWLLRKSNFIDQLTVLAPNLDIYVIPNQMRQLPVLTPVVSSLRLDAFRLSWLETFKCVGLLAVSTLVGLLFKFWGFTESDIIMGYMLGVLLAAMSTSGLLYSGLYSLCSVLAFNFFFTEPRFSFHAYDPAQPITFAIMFLAAVIISTLTKSLQQQKNLVSHKAYRTALLLETSQKLQGARDAHDIIQATAKQLMRLLGRTVILYPSIKTSQVGQYQSNLASQFSQTNQFNQNSQATQPTQENQASQFSQASQISQSASQARLGEPVVASFEAQSLPLNAYINSQEQAVAEWSFHNRKQAGAGTNTLSGAKCFYFCIRGQDEALGVVAIAVETPLDAFEKGLLTMVLGECALALDNENIRTSKDRAFLQAKQESLRANLLRAISHDLRTPLTSISGNAHLLLNKGNELEASKKQQLYADIYDDSIWLTSLVENILSVTRLEDGSVQLNLKPELLSELIPEAMRHLGHSKTHKLTLDLADELLMAWMDAHLIMQVIINIVDNAIKYTPLGSEIRIAAKACAGMVEISIGDNGAGIAPENKSRLFDMFFTTQYNQPDARRGLGLGLFLCKSIILAHGGSIWVADNRPQGTVFYFTLPLVEHETL